MDNCTEADLERAKRVAALVDEDIDAQFVYDPTDDSEPPRRLLMIKTDFRVIVRVSPEWLSDDEQAAAVYLRHAIAGQLERRAKDLRGA